MIMQRQICKNEQSILKFPKKSGSDSTASVLFETIHRRKSICTLTWNEGGH